MLSYLYLYNEFTFIHKFIRLLLLVTSIIIKSISHTASILQPMISEFNVTKVSQFEKTNRI